MVTSGSRDSSNTAHRPLVIGVELHIINPMPLPPELVEPSSSSASESGGGGAQALIVAASAASRVSRGHMAYAQGIQRSQLLPRRCNRAETQLDRLQLFMKLRFSLLTPWMAGRADWDESAS